MKTKHIFLLLFLCCTSLCFAQDQLFDKYADQNNVTSVFITKKMFQMMPNFDTGNLNLMNLKGKIDNLQILTSEKKEIRENMKRDFTAHIGKSHDLLMRVKDDGTSANFYIEQKGDRVNEMIMLADTDNEFVVIRITGNFTLQDIREVANSVKKQK